MRKVLIVGCGDIGTQVALAELQASSKVYAWVKSTESAEKLNLLGVQARVLDLDNKGIDSLELMQYDSLYYFVPPPFSGKTDSRMAFFVSHCFKQMQVSKVVLISTTGVYGDAQGQWIDESFPVNPIAERAFRRLDAQLLLEKACVEKSTSLAVLRVAGIYGPTKLPIARLKKAEPVLQESESPWSNRIYSQDLVTICYQAANNHCVGVFNVVDGNPTTMTDYFCKVADWAGLTKPEQIGMSQAQGTLSKGILSYLQESKRISNQNLLDCFELELKFPTLEDGLSAIFTSEKRL